MLKFRQKVEDRHRFWCFKRLVYHLDGDRSAQLLNFRCHIIIVSPQFMDETVRMIASRRLVAFIHRYKNFQAVFAIILHVRRGGWRVVMKSTSEASTPFVAVTAIVTECIRLIRRCNVTVCFWICLILVGDMRRWALGSHPVQLLRREIVFRLGIVTSDCLI